MSEYNFERLNLNRDLEPVDKLYAEVFAEPPWNEYTACNECETFYGLDTKPGDICAKDSGQLVLAYPLPQTMDRVRNECTKPDASAFVVRVGDQLIASAWGYSFASPEEFAKKKWPVQIQEAIVDLLCNNGINGRFFYFSECAVQEPYRGNGLSTKLSQLRLAEAEQKGLSVITRTNKNSEIVFVSEGLGMQQIMGPRVQGDRPNRRILCFDDAVNGIIDPTIPERVLFLKKAD